MSGNLIVPFFNTEMMYPRDAASLNYIPEPPPYFPRPPLIAPTAEAPAGRPARLNELPTIYMGKAVPPPPVPAQPPRARPAVGPPQRFQPATAPTGRRSDWNPMPLYVAPATPPPEPRPLKWQSLIPTPSQEPRLAPLPPYTPLPIPPPLVLRRTAPLPLFGLLRERIRP